MEGQLVPYPQFLKGEKGAGWRVQDSGGGSSPAFVSEGQSGRIIQVPLEGPCILCLQAGKTRHEAHHARGIRNHEQAHLRFTTDHLGRLPRMPKGLRPEYWNAVEDIRMDTCIRAVGIAQPPILCEHEAPKFIHRLKEAPDYMRVLWVASAGVHDRELIQKWLSAACAEDDPKEARLDAADVVRIALEAWSRMGDGATSRIYNPRREKWEIWPKLKNTVTIARWLQNLLDAMGADPRGEGQGQGAPEASSKDEEKLDPKDPNEYDPNEKLPEAEAQAEGVGDDDADDDDDSDPSPEDPNASVADEFSGWGEMVIDDPYKERALPGRLRRTARPAAYGEIPVSFERWMTDQKIFEVHRRHAGGTIVIDASGSMHLSQQQIYDWLEQFPGVTVAAYAGNPSEGFGTLRILANKGRVVAPDLMQPPGGYNTIDGPALAWLCKQPMPRVWISDGHVNGIGGVDSDKLNFDRDMLVSKGKIAWVNPHTVGWTKVGEWVLRMLKKGNQKGQEVGA